MGIAVGVLGKSEAEFWAMTPHALYAALDAYAEANGDEDALRRRREEEFAEFRRELEGG